MYKNICIFNELCDKNNIDINSLLYLCGRILKGILSCPKKLRIVGNGIHIREASNVFMQKNVWWQTRAALRHYK